MSAEAVLTGNRVFEEDLVERHQGESHVGTEEDKEVDGGEIGGPVGNGWLADDGGKGELSEDNCDKEGEDVYREDWFFAGSGVGIKNEGDEEG